MKKCKSHLLNLFVILSSYALFGMNSIEAKTYNIAIGSAPNNLSPFFSTDSNSQNINRLLHLTLIDFDRSMKPVCVACETFSDRIVNGKHIIKFKLKENLKFWDGSKLDANSIKHSHELFTETDKIKSIFRFAFGNIEKVNVISPLDVELVYKKYGLDNLSNLALFKIMKLNGEYNGVKSIVGAGEYKLVSETPLAITIENIDNKSQLIFKVVKDETTLALKLLNNEVDGSIATISPRKIQWLKNNSKEKLNFYEMSSSNYAYINFNHKKPPFDNLAVRKAIGSVLPIDDVINYKFKNQVVKSTGMFAPTFGELYLKDSTQSYNLKIATESLRSAGYKKNKDGIWEKEGVEFSITWKVSNSKSSFEIVKTLASYLERFGIKVEILTQEWGTFMRSYKKGDFDIVLSQWVGFTDGGMLEYVFHSEKMPPKGANRGYYSNSEVDELINNASRSNNTSQQVNNFKKVISIINRDYAYINLWHPMITWVFNNKVKGVNVYPNGSFIGIKDIHGK
ncbi:MAG: ABC transporter substrate-binding protein [Oligoflexia bacterium]|nr:ABC transporter substrate-binding protein [Oligoflexia bacterium]